MKTWQVSVKLDNIKKTFGNNVVLDIPGFTVNSGDIMGLVGNNGAGKTTLFRIILDLLQPDEGGKASINEFITHNTEDWKDFTGAYIDAGFLIDYLTPEEYFDFIAKINGMSKEDLNVQLQKFEHFMGGEVIGQNKLIRNLSAGNQQKVGIISAMLHQPGLLILDEPFNFLDPSSQLAMKRLLEDYNKETGATILVSSHNLSHTLDICTRVTLLEHGHIIKDYDQRENNPGSDNTESTKLDKQQIIDEIQHYFEDNQ